jgi:hypothetical protein
MPVRQGYTTRDGERVGYYQWGEAGKKYTYTPGDEEARDEAREKARAQQRAAYASGYSG